MLFYLQVCKIALPLHQNQTKKHEIMLVSESRNEKNLQDAKADYQAQKLKEINEQKIQYLESKIRKEKEAIIDCLNQNFFSIAKSKIERIEEMTKQINSLR